MKRTLIIAVLTIAATSLAVGQMKSKTGKQSAGLQETLMQVEQELVDALVKGDVAPWERYLADTFMFTAPDGTTQNKTQFIDELKSGALKMESSKNADMKVRVYGDTAVVTYRSTDKGTDRGNDISGNYRWTDVFVKRNGRWQIVSTQGTSIAKP